MTTINRSWRRSGTLVAAAAAGVLAVGMSAGPALAHTPVWSVDCAEVNVKLTNYGNNSENTVTITVDGKDLLPTETFKNDFEKKLELPKHDKELTVRLVVKASDGDKFSRDETKTAPVCEDNTTPPPSATPSPSTPPTTPAPSQTPSDTPSTATSSPAAPAPSPTPNGDLAETGSSSSTPLIAGAAAVIVVAGGGIMWAARKRRTTA
ncbi:LAETG motif-containing sortase-dependent surface protein [Streptomyces sp. NPDC020681]|uniref:LAETG motif-containing sortase-dependent surface protein n=1 Tax=Streptomyces sp. NPDC020681 TaxID=3365083 RepID=UPI00378D4157